jgi:hypothetical protein
MEKKVWCGILEGAIYEQNCLFKLAQTIPGNKNCQNCVFFENIQLRNKIEELKLAWKKKVRKFNNPTLGK